MKSIPNVTIAKVIPPGVPSFLYFALHPLRKVIFKSKPKQIEIFVFTKTRLFYLFDKLFFSIFGVKIHYGAPKNGKPDYSIILQTSENYDLLIPGGGIVPEELIRKCTTGVLLFHFGKLPYYRGMDTIEWSILFGREVATTCYFYNSQIDSGDIVQTSNVTLNYPDSRKNLINRTHSVSWNLVTTATKIHLENHVIQRMPQPTQDFGMYYGMHPFLMNAVDNKLRNKPNNEILKKILRRIENYQYFTPQSTSSNVVNCENVQKLIRTLHSNRKKNKMRSVDVKDALTTFPVNAFRFKQEEKILLFNELLYYLCEDNMVIPSDYFQVCVEAIDEIRLKLSY